MAFPARYKGTCKTCGQPITVGQYITWSRREKGAAYHADCANPDVKPEPSKPDFGSPESITAALEAAVAKIMESKGIPIGGDPIVPASEPVKPEPVKPVAKLSKLKDNAPWFDLLTAIVNWANENKEYIRILLIGPPGTGKSTTSLVLTGTENRVTFTEGMGVEDLIGMYQLIKGETVWTDGPIVTAMRKGQPILWDEVDHHPTEVGSGMYGWLDDKPHATLPTGEIVKAEKGYSVIGTTNSNVTALPEAILDRFDAVLPAILPHPDALAQFDNTAMRDAVCNHFRNLETSAWQWSGKPTLRRMRAFAKLKPIVGELNAATLAFGSAGEELLGVLTTASRTASSL